MYRDESNPVLCEENYIQSRVPDIVALGNLLKMGKGNNRTMAEYAKQCGASPSTFSRIATGKITQPLSYNQSYRALNIPIYYANFLYVPYKS